MGAPGRLCVLSVVIAMSMVATAHAQEVRWEGECSAEGAGLPGEVAALIGQRGDGLTAVASVTEEGAGLHLTLRLLRAGTPIGERALDAADCGELLSAAALVVALAVDPVASGVETSSAAPEIRTRPASAALAAALAPPPQRAASAPRPTRNASSSAAIRRARARSVAPDAAPASEIAGEEEDGAPYRPALSLAAGFVLDAGALPNAAPGVEARVGIALGPLRLEGGARVFFEQQSALGQHPTGRGHFGMAAGSLGACLPLGRGMLVVGPCVGLEVGAIWASSTGVSHPGSDTVAWVAPNASGLFALDVASWLRLRLDLGLSVPLIHTEFVVDGIGPVHTSSPITFRGGLGAEVRFR